MSSSLKYTVIKNIDLIIFKLNKKTKYPNTLYIYFLFSEKIDNI